MGNTKFNILKIMRGLRGGLSVEAIAALKWPKTKQLDKKAKTCRTHLRTMIREGWVTCDHEKYSITQRGIAALEKAEQDDALWRRRYGDDRAKEAVTSPAHLRQAIEYPRTIPTPAGFSGFPRIAQ